MRSRVRLNVNSNRFLMALWPSGLGNYFVCRRFPVQTLLWSLEFVIQINLEHDTIASLKLGSKLKYLNIMDFLFFRKVRDTSLTCKIVVFPSYLSSFFSKQPRRIQQLWSTAHQLLKLFIIINRLLFYFTFSIYSIFKLMRQILLFYNFVVSVRLLQLISTHQIKPYSSGSSFFIEFEKVFR